jgi:hypothetical protein
MSAELKSPDAQPESPPASIESDAAAETLYLTGRPTLKQFVRFVKGHAVEPPGEGTLAEQWQAAREVVHTLEREEAGAADDPPRLPLGPEYEPLLIELLKDPLVRNGFNTVPTEVVMVELDRLIVYQKHIDITYAGQLARRLGPDLGGDRIFRACLPYDHPAPPVKWSRMHGDKFVFMSPSNDLRFLGALSLQSRQIDHPPPGALAGVVGLAVGFGSNFMNAVYAEKRLILNNGSHRAYVLRQLGVTHAPCIVQHVSTRDELDLVAASEIRRSPDLFLKAPRPAMLRDYFDPRVHTVVKAHRRLRQVTVRFEVDESYVPAL